MSLELSKCGMGSDISLKFSEFLPVGSMISSEEEEEEERKKERKNSSDCNRVLGCLAARTLNMKSKFLPIFCCCCMKWAILQLQMTYTVNQLFSTLKQVKSKHCCIYTCKRVWSQIKAKRFVNLGWKKWNKTKTKVLNFKKIWSNSSFNFDLEIKSTMFVN